LTPPARPQQKLLAGLLQNNPICFSKLKALMKKNFRPLTASSGKQMLGFTASTNLSCIFSALAFEYPSPTTSKKPDHQECSPPSFANAVVD